MERRREPGGLVAKEAMVEETDRENPRLAKSGSGEGVGGEESGGQSHLPGGKKRSVGRGLESSREMGRKRPHQSTHSFPQQVGPGLVGSLHSFGRSLHDKEPLHLCRRSMWLASSENAVGWEILIREYKGDADLAAKSSRPRTPGLLTWPTRRNWSTGCTKDARCRTADLAQVRSAPPLLQAHASPPVRQAWREA
ncbi:hypothetical protein B296_00048501 [Ensete ventricosum]|uniref:Uncharacterized protein n=1 Tax=Ensete ventricosum TaxID=4639 RepID=A0A426YJC3_ENSVE|nr:hypothetical protein B296_00048501 [Ensete ventricosum]